VKSISIAQDIHICVTESNNGFEILPCHFHESKERAFHRKNPSQSGMKGTFFSHRKNVVVRLVQEMPLSTRLRKFLVGFLVFLLTLSAVVSILLYFA
jgi:hypothetical protein